VLVPPALVVIVVVEPLSVDSVAALAAPLVELTVALTEPTALVAMVALPPVMLELAAWVVAAWVVLASVFVVPSPFAPPVALVVAGCAAPLPSSLQLRARQRHESQSAVAGQLQRIFEFMIRAQRSCAALSLVRHRSLRISVSTSLEDCAVAGYIDRVPQARAASVR